MSKEEVAAYRMAKLLEKKRLVEEAIAKEEAAAVAEDADAEVVPE